MGDAFGGAWGNLGCGGGCSCTRCKGLSGLGRLGDSQGHTLLPVSSSGAVKSSAPASGGGVNAGNIMTLLQSGFQVAQSIAPLFQKVPAAPSGLVPVVPSAPPVYAPPPAPAASSSSSLVGPALAFGALALFGGILVFALSGRK